MGEKCVDDRAPPVPPRPTTSEEQGLASAVNPYAFNYGYGMPSGNLSSMYGNGTSMDLTRLAQQSSRGALDSFEAVVTAVNCVANLLNSTHSAIYSSFRALVGVIDQLSRLKSQIVSVVFVSSILRWLQRVWRSILTFLRIKSANCESAEDAWLQASHAFDGVDGSSSSWGALNGSTLLFWLIALGGPWLIYKCIVGLVKSAERSAKWVTGDGEHYTATALYDFNGQNERELSFHVNDSLRIAPKHLQPPIRGWLLASSVDDVRMGLVPMNYIRIIERKSGSNNLINPSESISEDAIRRCC